MMKMSEKGKESMTSSFLADIGVETWTFHHDFPEKNNEKVREVRAEGEENEGKSAKESARGRRNPDIWGFSVTERMNLNRWIMSWTGSCFSGR